MKIYMDVCCYNRPFDDQNQDRIRLEAEAVMVILFNCQKGEWNLVSSDIVDIELRKTQNPIKKQKASLLASIADSRVYLNEGIELKSNEYQRLGIDLFDSLHIACAEESRADIMLSTDDVLIKRAQKSKIIKVRIENPVKWLMEVTDNNENND
ncbi:hypothetical protein [Syntrophomonas wolfei]|uniref:PIN domain-containing protein n=1 Tax=Syntrophomonas wolfei subsp. wolfei (strain DSM 2245B / Goettingen) TaxID=335541 RepID=Q0B0L4_SYNWW|nr:hypothetical protein [Syntrophomonas wolfei]ABI67490.1 conserved hypothetical protein [Syntrophomonas wolfei subsp. wolfei str. Goettingen G311]